MSGNISGSIKKPVIAGLMALIGVVCAAMATTLGMFFSYTAGELVVDGNYKAERGFYKTMPDIPDKCPKKHTFLVKIQGEVVSSNNKYLSFVAPLNSQDELEIDDSHLLPIGTESFRVTGPIDNAEMFSEPCGEGYFKLSLKSQ